MNHFYFGWAGNKRSEIKHFESYLDDIENWGIHTIVEPFCGSGAFSHWLSKKYPKKFKYILNDSDQNLISMLRDMKDDIKRKSLEDNINNCIGTIKDKNDYIGLTGVNRWFIHHKFYNIRAGLYPVGKEFKKVCFDDVPFTSFLKDEDVSISSIDGTELIKNKCMEEGVLFFIDPPYIETYNEFYQNNDGLNVYEWFYNNNINNFNAYLLMILENNWIINLLFKNDIKGRYGKLYQPSKKKTEHYIITNY